MRTTADNIAAAVAGALVALVAIVAVGWAVWAWDSRQLRLEWTRLTGQPAVSVRKRR